MFSNNFFYISPNVSNCATKTDNLILVDIILTLNHPGNKRLLFCRCSQNTL